MASVSGSDVSDGPVLSLMNKRLRALKKKYNRILQMEENLAQGKPLNREQEDVLRSKPCVSALIDEYEKLRQPLSSALQEELSRFSPPPEPEKTNEEEISGDLEDLLGLLYFGCLFDVKSQSEFTSTMLTRTHERGCCLTYDYVTDDATELLGERDLDMISSLGGLLTSRPVYAGVSHRNALQGCIQHAKLWLRNSDQPIHPGTSVTYAGLRETLNKIMASDYFTTTPEMKDPVDVAAAVGKFNTACQVQVPESVTVMTPPGVQIDGAPAHYQHKEDEQEDFQATEVSPDQSSLVDEPPKMDEASDRNSSEDLNAAQQEQEKLEADSDHNQRDSEQKEQQQYIPRRAYQNQRGGSRGGGRRGYANGRGGRSSRGGGGGSYQNGRSQQYYDPGYYPRNYYNTRGRGGGRSGSSAMYNNSNHGAAATRGGHVELNASSKLSSKRLLKQ